MVDANRPEDLRKQLEQSQSEIQRLRLENKVLRQKLDALARRMFGKSSEKLDDKQLQFLLDQQDALLGKCEASAETEAASAPPAKPTRQRKRNQPDWRDKVEIKEEVVDPLEVQAAPDNYRKIGEEVREQLDYQPARLFLNRLVRNKYVSRLEPEAAPIIAPLPESLQDRCQATPSLIASIVVGKYRDHLPLYRQESIFKSQHGIFLPRQTLGNWVGLAADWLELIVAQIHQDTLSKKSVQIDETPVSYLRPGSGKAQQGYLWVVRDPTGDSTYHWHTGRGAACLESIIPPTYCGMIQCDGYSAYDAFANRRGEGEITLVSCMAHVRRAIFEAKEQDPRRAALLLKLIGQLYKIEEDLRRQRAGPKLREAVRASQSRPLFRRIEKVLWLWREKRYYLPQSAFAKALDYALGQWNALSLYLEHGKLEIDNNLVENAIRPTAIGKKNWLFFGDADAGHRSAVLFTIIESCRRWQIDSYEYLCDVLTKLPSMTNQQIAEVTPRGWAAARKKVAVGRAA